jgi:transcriptional regulator with XRE-family HTH domain
MNNLDDFNIKPSSSEKERRKQFGSNIRMKRLSRNISMDDLAKRANISSDLILRIESGLVSPDLPGLQKRINYALERELMVIA